MIRLVSSSWGDLPMDEHLELDAQNRPMLARARAINTYADLENLLCLVLSALLEVEAKTAGIIFYRIPNTRSRNVVLEELLKERHGAIYRVFWNSVMKELSLLDEERNKIVHWHSILIPYGDYIPTKPRKGETLLVPANIHAMTENTPFMGQEEIKAFIDRCDHLCRLMTMFIGLLHDQFAGPLRDTLLEICQSPIEYPPPTPLPVLRARGEPRPPPDPFEA
jgi:hypothetical protein